MNECKLSKGQWVGYIALCVVIILFTYMSIRFIPYAFEWFPDIGRFEWETSARILSVLSVIVLITAMLLFVAVLASFVFHFIQIVLGKNEKPIGFVGVEAVALLSTFVSIFFAMTFGDSVAIRGSTMTAIAEGYCGTEYSAVCAVFSLIGIGISFAMLGINFFRKKDFDKKLKIFFCIGMGFVVALSLAVFIPHFAVLTTRQSCS